jgi:hypothetical protein
VTTINEFFHADQILRTASQNSLSGTPNRGLDGGACGRPAVLDSKAEQGFGEAQVFDSRSSPPNSLTRCLILPNIDAAAAGPEFDNMFWNAFAVIPNPKNHSFLALC